MKKISKKSLLLWRIRLSAITLVFAVSAFLLPTLLRSVAFVLLTAVFFALFFIYYPIKYKSFFYKIEENALIIKSGVFYKSEKSIPLDSIQYISFVATPIEQLIGVKTAVIFTAGAMTLISAIDKHDDL